MGPVVSMGRDRVVPFRRNNRLLRFGQASDLQFETHPRTLAPRGVCQTWLAEIGQSYHRLAE